jgi:DNA ligase (NAD+)
MDSLSNKIKNAIDLSNNEFKKLLSELDDKYYNESEENIPDETYDSLIELYNKKFGEYKKIGAQVPVTKFKEKLPKYLGSLDKIRTVEELKRWMKKYIGSYVITDKVDGVSAVYGENKLWTRGDGNDGTNISHILKYFKLPVIKSKIYIRGEIYIPKDVFEKKYKDEFSNARNMVTGILNPLTKTPNIQALKDLRFAAYEFDDGKYTQCQEEQLEILGNIGFDLPYNEVVNKLTIEYLDTLIRRRKLESNYDMDGLVIVNNIAVKPVNKGNPDNAIAFKIEGEVVIAKVKSVEWNASKHGVLKPRVNIEEVILGVKVNWATGFNAKFIFDNKVGKGAKIKITRSGDVIPYIKEVIEQAEEADMPHDKDYEWNETNVDIVLLVETDDVKIRKIVEFFDVLDAKFVGKETIKKLFENGFTTLQSLFNATSEKLKKIEGIQTKSAQRIVDAIKECINDVPLAKLSAASGTLGFGFGKRNMEAVLDVYPDILDYDISEDEMIDMIMNIKGFSSKRSIQFASNIHKLKKFIKDHPMITIKMPNLENDIEFEDDEDCNDNKSSLKGKTIVFTGVRDQKIEDIIHDRGGKVTTSVSGKTDILVVAQRYSGSSKEIKAEQMGKEILNIEDFKKKYI